MLMKEVRALEVCIANWQDQLRQRVHKSQIDQYKHEGENRVDEFCTRFDREFENLQKAMIERR